MRLDFDYLEFLECLRAVIGKGKLPAEPRGSSVHFTLDGVRHLTPQEWMADLGVSRARVYQKLDRVRARIEAGVLDPYEVGEAHTAERVTLDGRRYMTYRKWARHLRITVSAAKSRARAWEKKQRVHAQAG